MARFRNFDQFVDWAAGYVLTQFIEEGGKGINGAINTICSVYYFNFVEKKEKKD